LRWATIGPRCATQEIRLTTTAGHS